MIKQLVLAATTLFSTACFGAKFDADRTAYIDDVIESRDTQPLAIQMLKWAADSNDPIKLIINSPGGDVAAGYEFIAQMEAVKASGTPIVCYVPHLAASMAFQILLHCSERHALPQAFVLFHRVRVQISRAIVTGPLAKGLANDLLATDAEILRDLRENLDMPERVLMYHFEHETLHTASRLARLDPDFFDSVDTSIPELLDVVYGISDSKIMRSSQFREHSLLDLFNMGRMYISPYYMGK